MENAAPISLPRRDRAASKRDFGRLLIVAGSVGYTGAPTLASRAAVRGGAGLVYLGVPRDIYAITAVKNDEAMPFPLPCDGGGLLTAAALEELLSIKQEKKRALCQALQQREGVALEEDSIFDIQIKRLHEYKRQQMNALYIIWKYRQIKAGHRPTRPITLLFGAKAAPAYTIAKDIIHLILCLQDLIAHDPQVSPWLKVHMVENYNITWAEKLIPACDISEQISLASKEASGTGNMKFMLNGAVTLGTLDGANVEIHDLVGEENVYIFGQPSEKVMELYDTASYRPGDYYGVDEEITQLVDFIISPTLMRLGDPENLARLYKDMSRKDWFMALLDVKDYIQTKERALADYEDRAAWAKKMLVNIAKAGYFSSDRSVAEYERDIWKLRPVPGLSIRAKGR